MEFEEWWETKRYKYENMAYAGYVPWHEKNVAMEAFLAGREHQREVDAGIVKKYALFSGVLYEHGEILAQKIREQE